MRLILHDGMRRQVEKAPESTLDARCCCVVAGRLIPNGDDVFLETDGYDDSADFLADHELLAKHGHAEDFPVARREAFSQPDDPLSTIFVGFVLCKIQYSQK